MDRTYLCIDLKSFYASAECSFRGLDPLSTNLVVADTSRTEKTICLAVSPSLKSFGIPGRARLFEVIQAVEKINKERRSKAPYHRFIGKSYNITELNNNPALELDYIAATPQMQKYIDVSSSIYDVYLKYVAKEDIHVYSIDEVFMDITDYLNIYKLSAYDLARKMISEVLALTGITATAGIGTNMYLAKVAMDIVAKHIPADKDGVRIAFLDEMTYRYELWNHKPITDFWRVGHGIAKRLEHHGLYTMGDIARCSLGSITDYHNEDLLYKEFGINAELLIDHAWGYEPCKMSDVKSYKPTNNSVSVGQVLSCAYDYEKALLIVKEMAEALSLDLVNRGVETNQIALAIGYDISNTANVEMDSDWYGRTVPKGCHSSINLDRFTSATTVIVKASSILFDRIVNKNLSVRRINICAGRVLKEGVGNVKPAYSQLSLFEDYDEKKKEEEKLNKYLDREKARQKTILDLKKKFGKNAVVKGMDLEEGGTTIERNKQIGGHKA